MHVSVVIPAYNAARFIRETLQSVLNQTVPPHEVIVVDDGSTDGTAEIAESFGPPVQVLRTVNQRAAVSRNLGVERSTSDWIAFLDADDVWEPHKLERQIAELARNPEADLCYAGCKDLQQEGETFRVVGTIWVPSATEVRKTLLTRTSFVPSSVLMRKSTFLAAGGFDPARRYTQDWDLWLRLVKHGVKFAVCREPLFLYRTHPNNMSSNALASSESAKEVYRKYIPQQIPPLLRWFHRRRWMAQRDSGVASQLYAQGEQGYLKLKVRSIFSDPFCQPGRYAFVMRVVCADLKKRLRPDDRVAAADLAKQTK